jgi:hypothetical protein
VTLFQDPSSELPWAVVYHSAYYDYDILALFRRREDAEAMAQKYIDKTQDDEAVEVVPTSEALLKASPSR